MNWCRPLLLQATLILIGCRDQAVQQSPPPVIIISVDTLRSDRLPVYGYRGVRTPNIDRFRDDAVLFSRAFSHSPLTAPSHASLFTGLLPAEHGVRDNAGFSLRKNARTLSELLQRQGYATGAAVSSVVLGKGSGIERGFHFYDARLKQAGPDQALSSLQRSGPETLKPAKEWIAAQSDRFFFFLHLYEPHAPYEPPPPFRERYADPYDGEIAFVDSILGEFFAFLRQQGIYDQAAIFLLSDHGEGLGEHQEKEHGIFLYREALQVPLLVKLPYARRAGERVDTPVGLTDVYPTVLQLSGGGSPARSSLLAFLDRPDAGREIYSESLYGRLHFGWSELHSLIGARFHYIDAPEPELFDLHSDPSERKNSIADHRRVSTRMRASLRPFVESSVAPPGPIPEESAEQLAALGYLTASVRETETSSRADPKRKIESLALIEESMQLMRTQRYQEAVQSFDRLLRREGEIPDVLEARSRALVKLGRLREAKLSAKRALQASPANLHFSLAVARICLALREDEEAQAHARLAVQSHPAVAHELLAQVALLRNELGRALEHALLAHAADEERLETLLTLARIEERREQPSAALAWYDRAVESLRRRNHGPDAGVRLRRAQTLARLGRLLESEQELRAALELEPGNREAYRQLILLSLSTNRPAEATRLVYELIEKSDDPDSYRLIIETMRLAGDRKGERYWLRRAKTRHPREDWP